jgi:hypothetical protein
MVRITVCCRSLEVTVPDCTADKNSTAAVPSAMKLINSRPGSNVEVHQVETFNLVEEVYIMEDSKRELHPVAQEIIAGGNHAFRNHRLSFAEETVLDADSLASSRGLVASEQPTEKLPSSFSCKDTLQSPSKNISDTSVGRACNGHRTPRNLSPLSEESAADNSNVNLDPLTRTYVSYSTPSLDDVPVVEAISESSAEEKVTKMVSAGSTAELNVSRDVGNNTTGVPQPLQLQHFVVVAIDIGTTYSGYAFCFTRDPDSNIHMMRKWEGKILSSFCTFYLFLLIS